MRQFERCRPADCRRDLLGALNPRGMLAGLIMILACAPSKAEIVFRHAFDNSVLAVSPRPGETVTAAVQEFIKTGKNPGSQEAWQEGKKLFEDTCANCHAPDGSGGMGPSLIDDNVVYERIKNDVGLFEVIYGGAAGAMQPFGKRLTQDQILKVMTYVRSLLKK